MHAVQMHTFDIPLSLKVFLIPYQKIAETLMDSLELHSHNMCKEVLPKSRLAHLPLIFKNKFRLGKQMLFGSDSVCITCFSA